MSKEDVNKTDVVGTEEDIVVAVEDIAITEDGEVIEEDVVIAIEGLEAPKHGTKRKILKGVLVSALMLLGVMVVFSSGFYVGAHVGGGSGGGRGGKHDFTVNSVEPIEIETGEGYQNITTLPHVLTEEDDVEECSIDRSAEENDTKDIKYDRDEEADDIIQPMD